MNSDTIRHKIDEIRDIESKIQSLKMDIKTLDRTHKVECTFSADGQRVTMALLSEKVNGVKLKDAISSQLWQDIKRLERELSDKKALLQVAVDDFTSR